MSEASQSVQELLNAALRKAEMNQLQLQLELRFKKNMEIFKKAAQPIYDQFIQYEPKELRLSFDAAGYLNLVNYTLDNKPVYPEDPQVFTRRQVEDFCQLPSITSISFAKSKIINERHIHPPLINDLIESYAELGADKKVNCDVPVGMMLMTGCGLGYQLPLLMEKMDIRNLTIFDPHKDSFYASLHVIDWEPILLHFCQPGHMIKFLIGMESNDAMTELKLLPDKIGLQKLVYTFVFRHFNSEKEDDFIQRYRKEFHLLASGTGFFDDEQISLAHTTLNLNEGTPVFRHTPHTKGLPPVFIIGNGPSLDKQINFIRANKDKVIVISCGTALGSLAKVGIKPEFHIEMERNSHVRAWIEHGTTAEFREGITLLCLNTASPEVTHLFKSVCIARKPNDIGEPLIGDKVPEALSLQLCNPTVTNAGLSYAISMGFKEIYLLGVDLGTAPDAQHHSKLSLYYDLEEKTQSKGFTLFEKNASSYNLKGNFGGVVSSNPILDATRFNMEILLRIAARSLGDVRCYNPNNGAFIEGAEPIPLEDIRAFDQAIDKAAITSGILNRNCILYPKVEITESQFHDKLLAGFFSVLKDINLKKDVQTPVELYEELDRIMTLVIRRIPEDPIGGMLLRGSLQGYFTLILKGCLFQPTRARFLEAYDIGRKAYQKFLKGAAEIMHQEPLKVDDTPDTMIVKLKN
ncbi:MAG: DUF115 domain-containing protein [Cellvibrionaceae bacterium]|nr:DUF115 domain-containing protein [Cellvibrionaceae bacterium]